MHQIVSVLQRGGTITINGHENESRTATPPSLLNCAQQRRVKQRQFIAQKMHMMDGRKPETEEESIIHVLTNKRPRASTKSSSTTSYEPKKAKETIEMESVREETSEEMTTSSSSSGSTITTSDNTTENYAE